MKHLWEVDHPFFGPDDNANSCESFAELRSDRVLGALRRLWEPVLDGVEGQS